MSKTKKLRRAKVSGQRLRDLMTEHQLYGNAGAAVVAEWLGVEPLTVQTYLSRGLRANDFELAVIKAAIWAKKKPGG